MLMTAGLHLAHVTGIGLALKLVPGIPVSLEALTEVEAYIAPATIGWSEGPIVSDRDGELYYPIIGRSDSKEANG